MRENFVTLSNSDLVNHCNGKQNEIEIRVHMHKVCTQIHLHFCLLYNAVTDHYTVKTPIKRNLPVPKKQSIYRRQGLTENSEQSKPMLVKGYQNKHAQRVKVTFLL